MSLPAPLPWTPRRPTHAASPSTPIPPPCPSPCPRSGRRRTEATGAGGDGGGDELGFFSSPFFASLSLPADPCASTVLSFCLCLPPAFSEDTCLSVYFQRKRQLRLRRRAAQTQQQLLVPPLSCLSRPPRRSPSLLRNRVVLRGGIAVFFSGTPGASLILHIPVLLVFFFCPLRAFLIYTHPLYTRSTDTYPPL